MIAPLLLAALLSSPVRAADKIAAPCAQDDMSRGWQATTFALWLMDGTDPDAQPRTATLRFKKCEHIDEYLGEPTSPRDARWFVSDDGTIGVIATVDEAQPDATYLTLVTLNGGSGLTNSAQLGVWAHRKVWFKGVGIDAASITDWRAGGKTIVKNVFVLPEAAVVKP